MRKKTRPVGTHAGLPDYRARRKRRAGFLPLRLPLSLSNNDYSVTPQNTFAASLPEAIAAAGATFARSLRRIKNLLGDPPLNAFFHIETRPEAEESPFAHCWRIEVIPRLTVLAGLELGGGTHINEVLPERAAEEWRAADARNPS